MHQTIKKLQSCVTVFQQNIIPVTITDDAIGVEVSSAFKNVYAVIIGICDGLFRHHGEGNYDNFNSFVFNQGMLEIARMVEKAGGRKETAFDLAGIGDFYVASLSGRNRRYGEEVGKGGDPHKTFEDMFAAGEVAEGYMALEIALDWVKSLGIDIDEELPLLKVLYGIIFNKKDPKASLDSFIQFMRKRFRNGI